MAHKVKKIFKRILKVIGWLTLAVLLLLLLAIALIQLPAVQQRITQKAVRFLEEKIGTKVTLQNLYVSFPKNIVLKGLYLEDQSSDTLLYAGKLSINTDLWALTQNEIQLNNVSLENSTAFIKRAANDSAFNFSYIIEAFAGDSTVVPDTLEEKGWNFTLKKIALENINTHYHDKLIGNNIDLDLGEFQVKMDAFDLKNYRFSIDEITLEDTKANIVQTKLPEVTTENDTTESLALALDLDEINLKNVKANYTQQATGQVIKLDLGESMLKANHIDLIKQVIDLEKFTLTKTLISYQQQPGKHQPRSTHAQRVETTNKSSTGWKISLNELELADNNIQYYDHQKTYSRGAVDFDHLWITRLGMEARDILVNGADIKCELIDFSFREKSGFVLRSFRALINVSEDSAALKNFLLQTGNSTVQLNAYAAYESFDRLAETYPKAKIYADLNQTTIGLRDILYFSPALLDSMPLNLEPNTILHADASLIGTIDHLSIHHLIVRMLSDTYLKTRGTIIGLPDAKRMRFDLALEKFFTTESDMTRIFPDTLIPESLALPDWLNVSGDYKGSTEKAEFKTLLTSSLGSVDLDGKMDLDSTSETRGFGGKIIVTGFNVGELLKQPAMGKLTMNATVNSKGLTKEEMNSAFQATIDSFEYQGYQYEDFKLRGKVVNNVFNGWADLQDKNLQFTIDGDINFQQEVPHYTFTFDLKNADFNALHLSERPLKARGTLDVDMATADMRILNGSLGIRKVAIFNGDALYAVDSLLFASVDQEGHSEIKLESDLMEGSFEGTINVFTMPAVLREYFNTYYSLHDSVEQSYEPPQHFNFMLKLKKTDLLTDIILPELDTFVPGELKGEFDSEAKQLDLRFNVTEIQYSKIGVKSFLLSINSDSSKLNYNIFVDQIHVDSLRIDGLEFNGTVSHDSIRTNVIILDSLDLHKYVLGGTFFSIENGFEFKLNPKEVKLNYEDWSVPAANYIRFGGEKFVAHDVELANGPEKIILESKAEPGSPIYVGFRELNLEYLSRMVAQQETVAGLLHGDINLYPEKDNFHFTSQLAIQKLSIADTPWGDIGLSVNQNELNRYDVNFSLSGNGNNIRSAGYYKAGDSPSINLTTTISQFNLAALQPVAASQVKDIKGILSGQILVEGSPQKPKIDGSIWLRDTHFLSTYLNTAFNIQEEKISFERQGIVFDQFELVDERKNKASLNGSILTSDYRDFRFRLELITNNFRLLNTTEEDNQLFFGKVDVNANARIRGTMENPSVNLEVSLSDGSRLTYVVPQSEASVMEAQGIVKFVDKTFKADPFMKSIQHALADTVKSQFRGLDLTAKVELSDKESFTIIIDPTTDDQLTVKGNTTLTLQMDRTGDIQLSGRYEISEGTYNLSFYKFLKREFAIEKGSSLTWSGDPLNADMNIHAIFKVDTAPIELLSNQLEGLDPREVNQYKQRLPFLVYLNISGQLLKPDIGFRLEMPMEDRNVFGGNVYAKIQDINSRESDLNKQVFALLILKRFISDNPFENQAGGFERTARSSVSKILTEQLNRLSENVRGVELSFDVKSYEDYSSGNAEGQTELQLGVSKTLFNDKLVVKLSGNVDIEGQNTNRDATDYIGDLALEYKLTSDGRLRITGFRNSNYDIIDGELTETGAGLIYIKDYNTLRELFKANAKDKK